MTEHTKCLRCACVRLQEYQEHKDVAAENTEHLLEVNREKGVGIEVEQKSRETKKSQRKTVKCIKHVYRQELKESFQVNF